jgi:hypothetical protein
LFLRTITFTGSLCCTAVTNSPMSIANGPSPTNAITCRLECATCAAMASVRPLAMLARVPESENVRPRRAGMCRANHVATVPESQRTIASSRSRFSSSYATTCDFTGLPARVSCSRISSFHPFISPCAPSGARNRASS